MSWLRFLPLKSRANFGVIIHFGMVLFLSLLYAPTTSMAMDGDQKGSGVGECIYLKFDPLYCERIQPTRGEARCLAAGYRDSYCKGMSEAEGLCLELGVFKSYNCKNKSVNQIYCMAAMRNWVYCSKLD